MERLKQWLPVGQWASLMVTVIGCALWVHAENKYITGRVDFNNAQINARCDQINQRSDALTAQINARCDELHKEFYELLRELRREG